MSDQVPPDGRRNTWNYEEPEQGAGFHDEHPTDPGRILDDRPTAPSAPPPPAPPAPAPPVAPQAPPLPTPPSVTAPPPPPPVAPPPEPALLADAPPAPTPTPEGFDPTATRTDTPSPFAASAAAAPFAPPPAAPAPPAPPVAAAPTPPVAPPPVAPSPAPHVADGSATRIDTPRPYAPPPSTPGSGPAPSTSGEPRRVGGRAAAAIIGLALVVAAVVIGVTTLGGDDETADPDPTPEAVTPTVEPGEPTPETETETPTAEPSPSPTPEPIVGNTVQLPVTSTPWGAQVAETWTWDDGTLRSTVTLTSASGDLAGGPYVLVIPKSIAADVADVSFDPFPTRVIESDPIVAFDVSIPAGGEVVIQWTAQPDLRGEEPGTALARFRVERADAVAAFDAGTPTLTVTAPADGATVVGNVAILVGTTDPGSTVTVNDEAATVTEDGSWTASVRVPRRGGDEEFTVVAVDPYGRTATITWGLTFEPRPTPTPAPTPTPRPTSPPAVQPTRPPAVQPTTPPRPTTPPDDGVCLPTDPDC